jgi:hypothetical protein
LISQKWLFGGFKIDATSQEINYLIFKSFFLGHVEGGCAAS